MAHGWSDGHHEFFAYLEAQGIPTTISVEGDASSDEQRAGDILLTRPFFAQPEDWANTLHDCVPKAEWAIH